MAEKQFYRLFKVAKELNVGTTMLVEHLQEKGHDVDNSPNTKLPGELYNMLLKEFASEKLMKERAEQLSERRKEEHVRSVTSRTVSGSETPEEETEADPLSADQLRSRITPKRRRRRGGDEDQGEETPVKPVVVPPKEEPVAKKVVPEKQEPVEEVPEVKKEEPVSEPKKKPELHEVEVEAPQLKVVGKIDLDTVGKGKGKGKSKPVKPKAVPVEEEPLKEEPKVEKQPPVIKKEEPKEILEETPTPPPVVEEPKVVETPATEVPDVIVEEEETESEEEEENDVMRAGDRTPDLPGLKVMGKIELPGQRQKKKSKEEPKPEKKTAASGAAEDDDKPAKRRRRRKRKRKPVAKEEVGSQGGKDSAQKGRKGKKEKPSEKEVEESIRTTLSQMGKGAGRSRQRLRRAKRDADAAKREAQEQLEMEESRVIDVTEFISANEFANLIEVPVNEIITKCFQLGIMVSINQRLDAEVLTIIAEEYGFEINFVDVTEEDFDEAEEEDDPADLVPRSPIITVMGHVDHGKTTLLDHLRKTNVTSQEAGGITQHIGAYEVKLKSGRNVTFLDTPGHEAFTAMRARGAKATDVSIIVIAADDAVMPQTREAINHAQAADVPMIFALNKMDKAGADSERIKGQLAEMNLLVEDWGGNFQSQEISALKGDNVDELLEKVILEADLLDLKANPNRSATGTIIESRLDKGRGNVATLLVENGTLEVGDEMVAGIHYGKVRALINQNGERVENAGPAMPVQVLGLNGQPQAGDKFQVFYEDGKAKEISSRRSELYREQQFRQTKHITLEEITRRRAIGNFKELNIIIRGDVDGSVEALSGSLLKLSNDEVQVNIIGKGVGAITEADINLAIASDAVVIAFNVRPNALARQLAEREEIDVRKYSVIYDAINDVKDALEGLLSPEIKEEIMGTAEVREVFKVTKVGNVAGSYVTSGKIKREDPVRVIRDGVVIYDTKLSSLKRFKDDVKEVASGFEFGFMVESYNDIQAGDVLESYHQNEIKRKLQ